MTLSSASHLHILEDNIGWTRTGTYARRSSGGLQSTRLNLSNNQSFALCWEASREEAPHGAQAVATPVPCGFSASLADSPASGGRGRTTADGRAQSVAAGPAPAGTARSARAAAAHPHAPADRDPARDGSHHCEPGVAAGTVHC